MSARVWQATDPSILRELIAPLFEAKHPGTRLEGVDVLYVATVPGIDFRAWYALRSTTAAGKSRRRYFAVFLDAPGSTATGISPNETHLERDGQRTRPEWSHRAKASLEVPRLGMQLWEFPADPKLKGLRRLLDANTLRSILAGPLSLPWTGERYELVRYVPGKRAVLRFDGSLQDAEGSASRSHADPAPRALYCKVYGSAKAAGRAAHRAEVLWKACRQQPRAMPTSEPLHMDPQTASLWLRGLPGTVLDASAPEEALVRMGTGLAALHGTELSLPARWSPSDELVSVRRSATWITRAQPALSETLEAILTPLEERVPQLDFGPLVPCHGSFKLNHVLWDGAEARLLDVDSAMMASPWLDVANLLTHLDYLVCQGVLDSERAQRLAVAFRSGYEGQASWSWNDAVLDWFVASLLVRKQAAKCVKHLHADAGEKLARILQEASARCRRFRA